jgi:aminoglycoside phosphotransferase (APT) family kinase protein
MTVGVEEARSFLRQRYGPGADGVAELGGGDWSRAFSFCLDGAPLVARFGRYREDFLKDEWAMSLAGPDLPVPRVLEVGEAFGNAYAISERHVGRFLETLDEPSLCRLMPALLRALDALRLVPVSSGAGCVWRQAVTDATRWQEWLPGALIDHPGDRVSGWRAKLAATAELDHLFLAGERRLHDLLGACPELRHILHLDLLNRNVLVAEDSRSIEAVFDWGCLAFGDFLYEVAWFTFWAPWHPGLAAVDFRAVLRGHYAAIGLDVPNFDERLRCYELHIGLTHLAYCSFAGREADLLAVACRTREVLDLP